jgi:hypothetical protein
VIAPKFWPARVPDEFRENPKETEVFIRSRAIGRKIGDDRRFLGVAVQAALTENC